MQAPPPNRPHRPTAATVVTTGQVVFFGILAVIVTTGIVLAPTDMAELAVQLSLGFFMVFVGMKMLLWYASTKYRFPDYVMPSEYDPDLPVYAALVPMFREPAMVATMVESMSALQYPKDKLIVMLLVETRERDPQTRAVIDGIKMPSFIHVTEVPDVKPYGKQKALNVGLYEAIHIASRHGTTLDFCVIYDAEDRPEPEQLLKAVGTFKHYEEVDSRIACLQAPLRFSNQESSWVSRLMWVEYTIHFEWVLPGFAKLGLVPPLGGTSNHFIVDALLDICIANTSLPHGARGYGAWDPWNVTEDADLAGALAKAGYRIAMLDSYTLEVATVKRKALVDQRSRWLKGYEQTTLMFLRQPLRTMRQMGPVRWFVYVLFLGGTPLSIFMSTVFWALTIVYFTTRSPAIEQLFPPVLLYIGTILLVFGNFALFIQHVAAANKREGYGTVKYLVIVLVGIWPLLTFMSLVKATRELASPKLRHFWDKTDHGHDIHTLDSVPALANVSPVRKVPTLRVVDQEESA